MKWTSDLKGRIVKLVVVFAVTESSEFRTWRWRGLFNSANKDSLDLIGTNLNFGCGSCGVILKLFWWVSLCKVLTRFFEFSFKIRNL